MLRRSRRASHGLYTGEERPNDLLAGSWDLVFVSAFTRAASTAYAIAACLRRRGIVTALGGPHARAWPADAARYFDYVLGLTDRDVVRRVLEERAPARGEGTRLEAAAQPSSLPSLRRRAPFLDHALRKARLVKVVPILGSSRPPAWGPSRPRASRRARPVSKRHLIAVLPTPSLVLAVQTGSFLRIRGFRAEKRLRNACRRRPH